jgi:hypothetical protein
MAADLSGITAILNNNGKTLIDLNIDVPKIKKTLHNVENSLTDDIKPLRLSMDNILLDYTDNNESKDLEQIISWIISDLGMMHKNINITKETGLLQMYTKLT